MTSATSSARIGPGHFFNAQWGLDMPCSGAGALRDRRRHAALVVLPGRAPPMSVVWRDVSARVPSTR
jgi:hypothetical protein